MNNNNNMDDYKSCDTADVVVDLDTTTTSTGIATTSTCSTQQQQQQQQQQSSSNNMNPIVSLSSSSSSSSSSSNMIMKVLTNGRHDLWNSYYYDSCSTTNTNNNNNNNNSKNINRIVLLYQYIYTSIFNTYRNIILDPLFAIGTLVLPPLIKYMNSTYINRIVLYQLSMAISIMKCIYRPIPKEEHMNLRDVAKQDFMIHTKAAYQIPKYQPPSDITSAIRGAIAFTISVSADLFSVLFVDGTKMSKWIETMTELKSYLDISGVANELEESIVKPLYAGRLLDNLKILSDIQGTILYTTRHIDIATTTFGTDINVFQNELQIGQRMMRFATSAYGTEMIKSALDRDISVSELLVRHNDDDDDDNNDTNNPTDTNTTSSDIYNDNYQVRKAIAFHSGIDKLHDIRIMEINDGGDMSLLRHFVAIDHTSKSIVLAIRGTLSISGALVDVTAMDTPYYGGIAHTGMAEMANNIWNKSGPAITNIFNTKSDDIVLQDYSFTIVGHSLGAGVACLLTIKCYVEEVFGSNSKRIIQCFGFAPPPTFCYTNTNSSTLDGEFDDSNSKINERIQMAIDHTICYVHDNDCVPLLSIQSIRRFASLMDIVDNYTERIWFYQRYSIFWNWKAIPQDIITAVTQVDTELSKSTTTTTGNTSAATTATTTDTNSSPTSTSKCIVGASKLMIPAKMILWMKKVDDINDDTNMNKTATTTTKKKKYVVSGCTPEAMANLNIYFCQDMITDHLVEPYEDSLDELVKHFNTENT